MGAVTVLSPLERMRPAGESSILSAVSSPLSPCDNLLLSIGMLRPPPPRPRRGFFTSPQRPVFRGIARSALDADAGAGAGNADGRRWTGGGPGALEGVSGSERGGNP